MSDQAKARCGGVLTLLFLLVIPLRSNSQQGEPSQVHSKPIKVRQFKITVHKTIPEGATFPVGPNPYEFYAKPVSSQEVLEAWIRVLQAIGFSVNPSKPKTFLEPFQGEWGKAQGACWTDIQELQPEEKFQVNFKKLKLPVQEHLHYGFQIAARWSVETSEEKIDIPRETIRPPMGPPVMPPIGPPTGPPIGSSRTTKKPAWTKMRAQVALMIHERGERGSWTASTKDYNSNPVLVWLQNKLYAELYAAAHPKY
jgi:hypothetical protein